MNLFRKKKNKTVYIGLSGGVDSAVSAALLKDDGYNVVTCFIKTWAPDGYLCPTETDKFESMRVAAHLRIPWIEIDATDAYKKNVAEYMLNEYKNGRTPNPDVFCNTTVKFGTFYDIAIQKGADYVATGHYAKTSPDLSATLPLLRGGIKGKVLRKAIDPSKDQTYFLWNVAYQKLQKTLFPIGNLPKTRVRKLAKKYKLPNAERPDSQGVCFLGPIDMKSFIKDMLHTEIGNVLDINGDTIGTHDGSILYTIGERHGFSVNNNAGIPYFVVDKNIENNTITVSNNPKEKKFEKDIYIQSENWLPKRPDENQIIDAVFRYHGETYKIKLGRDNKLNFQNESTTPAEGQSVVFYSGEQCLGGGIVSYKKL